MAGHTISMGPVSPAAKDSAARGEPGSSSHDGLTFADLYDQHFDFVWRSARRLGVDPSHLEDVVQDVFITVHRRLDSFEGRSNLRTWVFGIALRVVRDHRRSLHRKPSAPLQHEPADQSRDPAEAAERSQDVRLLHRLLDTLGDDQREVFVLTELEQLTAPEIASMLEINLNTVYARIRAARSTFEAAAADVRQAQEAQDG